MNSQSIKRKVVWYGLLLLFFAGFLSFVIGFYNALSIGITMTQSSEPVSQEPSDPSAEKHDEKTFPSEGVQIMALGDSLARGTGDPEGDGFAERVARGLEERVEEQVTLFNFAVEGMRSEDLVTQLEDEGMMQGIMNARYILVSIGGNDLREVARLPMVQQEQAFEERLTAYLDNLQLVIEGLRSVNEEALILFIGLYNLDYNSPYDQETAYLLEWNYETQQLLETDTRAQLIPTYDLFQFKMDQYLSLDGLHPNAPGYEAIAQRILENLPEQ